MFHILTADFPPIEGGICTVTVRLAQTLNLLSVPATVYAPAIGDTRNGQEPWDFPVVRWPGYGLSTARFLGCAFGTWKHVRTAPLTDRIVSMNLGVGGVLSLLHAGNTTPPFDLFIYGFDLLKYRGRFPLERLCKMILNVTRRIYTISEFTENLVLSFGVPQEKTQRVPLAVDTDRYHPLRSEKSTSDPLILSVGRLIERKGHDVVLRALPGLLKEFPELRYVIAGQGPERIALESLAKALGIEQHVQFTGKVSDDELVSLYQNATLLVLPTRAQGASVEGFGLVFLEAAACGLPCIAGASGGVPEAVRHAETGLLVPPEDVTAFSEAVSALLKDPSLRESMSRNARRFSLVREQQWQQFVHDLAYRSP